MRYSIFLTCMALAVSMVPDLARPDMPQDALVDSGNRLAAVLRAGRSVVSGNQELINDPDIGDKGLTPDVFLMVD